MYLFVWIFISLLSFRRVISGYIETVLVSGYETSKLHLTCRHLTSIIAILEAEFLPDSNELFFSNNTIVSPTPFPPVHPRQALNQRCSGVNHCSFILVEDCPGADSWGPGNITVKYMCVSEDRIRKFCNSNIVLPATQDSGVSEGFIHNPGYPRFYSSERECRWRIKAPYQQRIKLTILDIAVTADNTIFPNDCTDHLEIIDSGQVVHSTCKVHEPPLEITSESDTVEVVLVSSHSLIPLRGFLVHFTAVGCPTPASPADGYLVHRNDTVAEFRCCVGFIFPDDGSRTRLIRCLGSFWDGDLPLPDCQRKVLPPIQESVKPAPKSENMASDILAPALLIVALFLINFMVLFYIYKVKQKQTIVIADEELGSLQRAEIEKHT